MNDRFASLLAEHWNAMSSMIDEVLPLGGDRMATLCRYHLRTGGKRIRAVLPLLVAETLGHDPARLRPFGAACEMLHNATLVHDDLQDGDEVRRGEPTVWKRFGMPQAVNLGDAMFYYTLLLVQRVDAPAALREAAARKVLTDTLDVIDGQARELDLRDDGREPTPEAYLRMVEGKTSGLFALPMAGAALLCEAPDAVVAALSEAARHLGVLFQIQDDLLDLFPGKGRDKVGNDLREGKRSFLVVRAFADATPEDAATLRRVLNTPREATTDADVADAVAVLCRAGAIDAAAAELRRRAAVAEACVPEGPLRALVRDLGARLLDPVSGLLASEQADADVAYCVQALPLVSRTFALSIELLPESLRDAVRVAYLLCRVVDTIEDDAAVSLPIREALFDAFDALMRDDQALTAAFAALGSTLDAVPAERELMARAGAVFRCFRALDPAQRDAVRPWVLEMSAGMRDYARRLHHEGTLRMRDLADLERYCWYVAGTVGELLTALFHAVSVRTEPLPKAITDRSASFGLGLQLVNILKDAATDAERGVCFLPADLAAQEGVDLDHLLDPSQRVRAMRLYDRVLDRAREHLRDANAYTLAWADADADVRMFCAVPLALAWCTLDLLRRGEDVLSPGRVPKVGRQTVADVVQTAASVVADGAALADWLARLAGESAVAAK